MNNFAGDEESTTYTEPEGALVYRGKLELSSDFDWEDGEDSVGLCVGAFGGGHTVFVGIDNVDDVQQFLYEAAVRSRLIRDGDPLILMKRVTADEEAA